MMLADLIELLARNLKCTDEIVHALLKRTDNMVEASHKNVKVYAEDMKRVADAILGLQSDMRKVSEIIGALIRHSGDPMLAREINGIVNGEAPKPQEVGHEKETIH